jgi:hypothetical protein
VDSLTDGTRFCVPGLGGCNCAAALPLKKRGLTYRYIRLLNDRWPRIESIKLPIG